MSRSRSSSRPASRPASRPPSMMSTALNLSPMILNLGDNLINKLTGFEDDEENFGICHDFLVSNLLYHTYLEPHERDVKKKCETLTEKWKIQNKTEKATRFEQLLEQYFDSQVFKEGVEHDQHGLRARLLVLLLSLNNSDKVVQEENSDNDEEIVKIYEINQQYESQGSKAARKAALVRAMLAEGEDPCRSFNSESSDLSDWSDFEDEPFDFPSRFLEEKKPLNELKANHEFVKKPVTHLPGVKSPLKPPQPIIELDDCKVEMSIHEAKDWIERHLIPPYWKEEADSRASIVIHISNQMPDSHYVYSIEAYLNDQGLPVDETFILPEYQVLYECIWVLRNPLCDKTPLFQWLNHEFRVNDQVCLSSLMPISLRSAFDKFRQSLTKLRLLHEFISSTLDRRKDPGGMEDLQKPPFTYEAFAEALSNIFNLLSADLLEIERKIKGKLETFTILTFFQDLKSWLAIIDSLGAFFHSFISLKCGTFGNWEKAIILLAGLDQAVNACTDSRMFSLWVDLQLKTLAPYFRIIGVWLTQGRLEDYRQEFVFGIHDNLSEKSEKFWTHGFIIRPYEKVLATFDLKTPAIFEHTLNKILTCGKSITILTILEKTNVYEPMMAPTDLYDKFLANLKQDLVVHKMTNGCKSGKIRHIPMLAQGPALSDIIGDVSEYDADLVAAYDIIAADISIIEELQQVQEQEDLIDPERFLILAQFGLDPLQPMASIMQNSFLPVVSLHTDKACSRLVDLFQNTLDLETHLIYLRRVFFMEAGDLLSEFYTPLFSKMHEEDSNNSLKDSMDNLSLNILLHDCLCRRFSSENMAEKFEIDFKEHDLDAISLSYAVSWPMNIVLQKDVLEMYNKVFRFLLKVKHSLWALLEINPKDFASRHKEGIQDLKIIHRIILLRSWLLHFISNVHDYFMTRVLQSTQGELHQNLMNCNDLDEILRVHNAYISQIYHRCFLHHSAARLKKPVFQVLEIALTLYEYVQNHFKDPAFVLHEEGLKSLEESYASQHTFLAATLQSMTQKRNVVHLESLAAALVHSCPTVI